MDHLQKHLSRRDLLIASSAAVAGLTGRALSAATGACVLLPEQEEGPYYVASELIRKNVSEDRKGIPLKLQIHLVNSASCSPLPNAAVDIWHCDASGEYSGYSAMPPGGPGRPGGPPPFGMRPPGPPPAGDHFSGPPPKMAPSNNKTFLRGVQLTDQNGCAEFLTIYPGWYVGRCIHIHLKVHIAGQERAGTYTGGHVSHTGQLFFPEEVSDAIAAVAPYSLHHTPRTSLAEDGVFQGQHGPSSLIQPRRVREYSLQDGLTAVALLAIDPKAEPSPVGRFGPGR